MKKFIIRLVYCDRCLFIYGKFTEFVLQIYEMTKYIYYCDI